MERLCTPHSIGFAPLYDIVKSRVRAVIAASVNPDNLFERLQQNACDTADLQKSLAAQKRRSLDLKRLIKSVVEQHALGALGQTVFSELVAGYQNDLNDTIAKIESIEATISEAKDNSKNALKFIELIKKHTEVDILTREIVLDLLDKIVVYEAKVTGRGRGMVRELDVDIYFRFVGKIN